MRKKSQLTVVIPCYNEEQTLEVCINRVLEIADETLSLEIIIVDDGSQDNSATIAKRLGEEHPEVLLCQHSSNQGKGAALRTGFQQASGDFVAVQDADLEYSPHDLKRLLEPLITGHADVVLGSRFLSSGAHRVLYFWHSLANRFLTLLSNMFTDLNLTDMETCYKVFKREVIQKVEIEENRFGVEPEIVAKIAHQRLRIYEMGISYHGRTYEEGKKIGVRDGFRALYCIIRYNAHHAPIPMQFMVYLFIGGISAIANLLLFLGFLSTDLSLTTSALSAFFLAAMVNYLLSILILFRHKARWNSSMEIAIYFIIVIMVGFLDLGITKIFLSMDYSHVASKLIATGIGLVLNFVGRRFFVFPEAGRGPWNPQKDQL